MIKDITRYKLKIKEPLMRQVTETFPLIRIDYPKSIELLKT